MTVNQFSIVPKILRQSDLVVAVVRRAITLSPYARIDEASTTGNSAQCAFTTVARTVKSSPCE